jgi:NAD(P)-dependent dehydrogenase (short-subunit alcohol dehydrogenase family)
MSPNRFESRVVLITGGTSGIGLASAKAFAEEGAHVIITGRDKERLESAQLAIGKPVRAIQSDISAPANSTHLIALLRAEYGRIDTLFLNAGIPGGTPIASVSESRFDEIFLTNFKGPYFLIQAALPLLPSGSTIVLSGSYAAHAGMPGSSVYGASKAALASLARTLSGELLDHGIRINTICPGAIETPIWERMLPPEYLESVKRIIGDHIPLQRFGSPEEVAKAVLFLASPESSYVVGTEMFVDGGLKELGSGKMLNMR